MEKDDVTRALLGTTQAVTMVGGGVKPNVLPERACATVNYRLFPGVEPGVIAAHASDTIDDERVSVRVVTGQQAPAPSDLESAAGRRLAGLIRAHFPDAVVVPVISPGVTDSRHFAGLADQIFRFLPVHLTAAELSAMHGPNERISVAALQKMYEFYVSYLRAAGRGRRLVGGNAGPEGPAYLAVMWTTYSR
jgi:carboxypeptidase PM20D1